MTNRLSSLHPFRSRRSPVGPINSSLELFKGLGDNEVTQLGQFFTTIDVEAGKVLGQQGQLCQYFGVLLAGQVGMSFDHTPAGVLTPGCFYGAVSLLDPDGDRLRRGTATAMVNSKLAVANPREFAGLLHASPVLSQRIRSVVEQRREYVARVRSSQQTADAPTSFPIHIPVSADAGPVG